MLSIKRGFHCTQKGVSTILRGLNHSGASSCTICPSALVVNICEAETYHSMFKDKEGVHEIKWLWIRTPIPSTPVTSKGRRGHHPCDEISQTFPPLFLPVHTVRMNWRWKWLRNKPCTTMIKTIIYSRSDKPYFCHVRLHCRWVEAQSACGERPERTLIHQSLWEVDLWVLLLYSLIVSRGGEGLGVRFWVWERGYILHSSNKMKVIMLSPFRQGTVSVVWMAKV